MKWPGGGGSGPRSGADLETPKTQLYQHASLFFLHFLGIFFACFPCFPFFCIFFAFFCIFFAFARLGVIFWHCFAFPRLGVIFLACFLHFPNRESFFACFCMCLHFLDRVCHLHRLPDPYEKTTRK